MVATESEVQHRELPEEGSQVYDPWGDFRALENRLFNSFFADTHLHTFPDILTLFSGMQKFHRELLEEVDALFREHQQFFDRALHDPNNEVHTQDEDLPGGVHVRRWFIRPRQEQQPSGVTGRSPRILQRESRDHAQIV